MELCQPKSRKSQKGKRYTEREVDNKKDREGGRDRERAIIKTQKPFKSSPNFVLDSVTPKRSQRNEILFGFFFFFLCRHQRQLRKTPGEADKEEAEKSRRAEREEQIMQLIIIHSNVTQSVSKPRPMRNASRTCRTTKTHTERRPENETGRVWEEILIERLLYAL